MIKLLNYLESYKLITKFSIAGICIVFLFLFQITFFTACLAWSGEHEEEGRSGLTLSTTDSDHRFGHKIYKRPLEILPLTDFFVFVCKLWRKSIK